MHVNAEVARLDYFRSAYHYLRKAMPKTEGRINWEILLGAAGIIVAMFVTVYVAIIPFSVNNEHRHTKSESRQETIEKAITDLQNRDKEILESDKKHDEEISLLRSAVIDALEVKKKAEDVRQQRLQSNLQRLKQAQGVDKDNRVFHADGPAQGFPTSPKTPLKEEKH